MNKRNWKIIYSNYSGAEKKAIELIYKELEALILRDKGVYTFRTLCCENVSCADITGNAIVIGTYSQNKIISSYIKKDEIPNDGYVVKVIDNPENNEYQLVLITALNPREVFYGAVDFVDDYFAKHAHNRICLTFYDEIFEHKLATYCNVSSPVIKTRNIFTWGHPINNYIEYIDNIARMKFNQLIIWNDYLPLNIEEVVKYAHEYGISVILGFAWGWSRKCDEIDFENLDELTDEIVEKYEKEYAHIGADGIYFQSFTELRKEYIGDKLIAEVVSDFVNKTSARLLETAPGICIQFGLHATSVKDRLQYIKNIDKRIDIIWEDCGEFPYSYIPHMDSFEKYQETKTFTEKILTLRPNSNDGVLLKGNLVLDWEGDYFVHQTGPYIMGKSSSRITENDRMVIKPLWKKFQNGWLADGEYAYEMIRHIAKISGKNATVGVAGQLSGGIWLPPALIGQILWECDAPYDKIIKKVLARRCIDMV